jgi:hypothetical protein
MTSTTESAAGSVDTLLALDMHRLGDAQLLEALDGVELVRRRVEAQRLAVVAEIESRNLAGEQGATSTAALLRVRTGVGRREAARLVRLAGVVSSGLGAGWPATGVALSEGRVTPEAAQTIGRTLRGLPAQVPDADRADAHALLLQWAEALDAEAFGRVAARLRERLVDAYVGSDDAAREEAAWRQRGLWLSQVGSMWHLRAQLDPELGATLSAMIDALSRPASSPTATAHSGRRRGTERRRRVGDRHQARGWRPSRQRVGAG